MIGQRIKELRQSRKMTMQELANAFGISRVSVAAWEAGHARPDQEKLPMLAKQLGTSVEYLLTGKKSPATARGDYDESLHTGPHFKGKVPLISWVRAGTWSETMNNFQAGDADEWILTTVSTGAHAYALKVKGISMEPEFREGDVIIVDPEQPANHGSFVVVRLDDSDEATFKQLIIEGGQMFLRALNPDWPGPKLIEINQPATICGVVVEKRKSYI